MNGLEIQNLFARTLNGDYEGDEGWDAVRELQRLGTRTVLDIAAERRLSADPLMRARGADVIAQLGKTALPNPGDICVPQNRLRTWPNHEHRHPDRQ